MNISFWKEKGSKYAVFVLVGLLILVMCIPTGSSSQTLVGEKEETLDDNLQEQLERVLSAMEGVGEVEVMISMESVSEGVFSGNANLQSVSGVIVVAEGAGNPTVDARISEAVKALFSIDVHKISIVKMRSQEDRK